MDTSERLDALLKNPPLKIKLPGPAVVFSDTHWGDGSKPDHFWFNWPLFEKVILDYKQRGFTTFVLGDWKDLWKFNFFTKVYVDYFDVKIGGNHDRRLGHPEAAVIEWPNGEVFVAHGHQGEWLCDEGAGLSEEVIEHLWKNLEEMGLKESMGDRHSAQRQCLVEWSNAQAMPSVFGHIHFREQDGKYFNIGSSVNPGRVECLELNEGIKLVAYRRMD
jgi:predicted phosphodiesterase